ncbi:MAG TPA: M1 family metallopeptidase, partial [Gemmatimonadales bacterium]|nr:M1 family metallopeptidase [Gemmatimonadales bacterium]
MRTLLLSLLATAQLAAQQPAAAPSPTDSAPDQGNRSPFRRLELPAPNRVRTGAGAPGPEYWQQRVDYVIRASLDTAAQTVTGEERISYANRSPDTLRYLWLQLDQNLFNGTSRGSLIFDQNSRFGTAGAKGGVTLTRVQLAAAKKSSALPARPAADLKYVVNGTMMRVDLPRPLPPGGREVLEIGWSFPFGPNSNRMGMEQIDGSYVYEVAQWYPRLAVYDDVRGWNTEQYLGQGEFYLEYGSFDVSLTVPRNMLVAATGTLQNPAQVLTATQRSRLSRARASDSTVVIRSKDEVADPASRPASATGTLTWRFTADSVRDFAWAAARHFVWDAARANGGRTVAMSFYPPSAEPIWKQSTQYIRFAIENYSSWYRYPYPAAINVNGIEGGMEYPMIVFCHNRTDAPALFSVTDHEIGHTWYPMVVGNNERRYAWMDEGFNT